MTAGRLARRMAALEKRRNPAAAWANVPVEQCPDHVLIAIIGEDLGWPSGHQPSDAELRAILGEDGLGEAEGDAP